MDLLLSFSDFSQFKEMMIFERAHFVATTPKPKSSKAAALGLKDHPDKPATEIKLEGNKANQHELKYFEDCIDKLTVSTMKLVVHKNEQEDGDEMLDLNLNIQKMKI